MSECWKPIDGQKYYFISNMLTVVGGNYMVEYSCDEKRVENGNYFKTEAEAEAAAKKVKALLLGLHYSETLQDNGEEPKLPDWCKVGEWIYTSNEQYLKIADISIDRQCVEFSNGVKWNVQDVVDEAVPARLRPYNAKEMKALVGKVLETKNGSARLITQYIAGVNELCFWENRLNADMLLSEEYIIDGKPAGVFEHLENGEWVE